MRRKILNKLSLTLLPFIIGIPIIIIVLLAAIFTVMESEDISTAPKNNATSDSHVLITNDSLNSDQTTIVAEVADDNRERAEGLMNRKFLANDGGMLFIFPEPTPVQFWMKDTYVSLDMIFLDESLKIVHIVENTEPLNTETTYGPKIPVKYVLEVKGGFTEQNNYSIGDNLQINLKQ